MLSKGWIKIVIENCLIQEKKKSQHELFLLLSFSLDCSHKSNNMDFFYNRTTGYTNINLQFSVQKNLSLGRESIQRNTNCSGAAQCRKSSTSQEQWGYMEGSPWENWCLLLTEVNWTSNITSELLQPKWYSKKTNQFPVPGILFYLPSHPMPSRGKKCKLCLVLRAEAAKQHELKHSSASWDLSVQTCM